VESANVRNATGTVYMSGSVRKMNFITGYPGTEQQTGAALRRVLGEEAYAAHLASLGIDSVRIPVNDRHFEDDDEPADESGARIGPFYARLERAIRAVVPRRILCRRRNAGWARIRRSGAAHPLRRAAHLR
jgi:hypothetical protein